MKKRKLLQLTILALTFVLLFSTTPLAAFASTDNLNDDAFVNNTSGMQQNYNIEEAEPLLLPAELYEEGYVKRFPEEEHNLHSIVVGKDNGTKTLMYFSNPIKYIDSNGIVKDKKANIKKLANGDFQTAQSDIITTFSKNLETGITISNDDVSLSLIPSFGTSKNAITSDAKAIQKSNGKLSSDNLKVTYEIDSETTYEYSLTNMGFKEDIVVSEYTGQTEFVFSLITNGLSLEKEYDSYVLKDDSGNVRAHLSDIVLITADEQNNSMGSMTVVTIKESDAYQLTVNVDAEWLKDENTAYPIIIDPSITITSSDTLYGQIEDVGISTHSTYGTGAGSLYIGKDTNGATRRALMRFTNLDLTGYTVTSAHIELRDLMCQSTEQIVECYEYIGNSWSNSTGATWSSCGSNMTGSLLSSKAIRYGNGDTAITGNKHRYAFDITSLAQKWANETASPSQGVMFKATDTYEQSDSSSYKTFASINRSSYTPSIVIEFSQSSTESIPSISFPQSSYDVVIGESLNLNVQVTPANSTITYIVTNPYFTSTQIENYNIASFDSNGNLTLTKAGTYTVTAILEDGTESSCTVHCVLEDGIYKLQNGGSYNYATFEGNGVLSVSQPVQYVNSGDSLKQMWKLKYVGNGYYTIRAMCNLNSMLHVWGSNAVYPINANDIGISPTSYADSNNISYDYLWKIDMIVANNNRCKIISASRGTIWTIEAGVTSNYAPVYTETNPSSTQSNQQWFFNRIENPPEGFNLYYTHSNYTYQINDSAALTMYIGQTRTIIPVWYSEDSLDQEYTWSSSNTDVATVDSNGLITIVGIGEDKTYDRNLPIDNENNTGTTTITVTSASGISRSFDIVSQYAGSMTICASSLDWWGTGKSLAGHVYIVIDNNTNYAFNMGYETLGAYDTITVSRYMESSVKNIVPAEYRNYDLKGIWYNFDSYAYHEMDKYTTNSALTVPLVWGDFQTISETILAQNNSYHPFEYSCVHISLNIWNAIVDSNLYLSCETNLPLELLVFRINQMPEHTTNYVPPQNNEYSRYFDHIPADENDPVGFVTFS